MTTFNRAGGLEAWAPCHAHSSLNTDDWDAIGPRGDDALGGPPD